MDAKSLKDFFKVSLFMSGTPANYQREMTKRTQQSGKESCECSLSDAIGNRYICTPILNLAKCKRENSPSLVRDVLKREIQISEQHRNNNQYHGVRLLVNMTAINDCQSCAKDIIKFKNEGEIDPNTHIIVIHSKKNIDKNKNNNGETPLKYFSWVDTPQNLGKNSEINIFKDVAGMEDLFYKEDEWEAWYRSKNPNADDKEINLEKEIRRGIRRNFPSMLGEFLSRIDSGEVFNGEPVILFQVDMLSEGLNIKSFNSVIIQTQERKKQMQQIGRVLRDHSILHNGEKKTKINDGWSSVYAIIENEYDVVYLMRALIETGIKLSNICWGEQIEIPENPDHTKTNEDEPKEISENEWVGITDVEINKYTIHLNKFLAVEKRNGELYDSLQKHGITTEMLYELINALAGNSTQSQTDAAKKKKKLDDFEKKIKEHKEKGEKDKEKEPKRLAEKDYLKIFFDTFDKVLGERQQHDGVMEEISRVDRRLFLRHVFDGNEKAVNAWLKIIEVYPTFWELNNKD